MRTDISKQHLPTVLVVGDWNLDITAVPSEGKETLEITPQWGGCWFLQEVIRSALNDPCVTVLPENTQSLGVVSMVSPLPRRLIMLGRFHSSNPSPESEYVLRIKSSYDFHVAERPAYESRTASRQKIGDPLVSGDLGNHCPDILVIYCQGEKYSTNQISAESWRKFFDGLSAEAPTVVILQANSGILDNDLWKVLDERNLLDRLVLITSAEHLRKKVNLCLDLSWERFAADFVYRLRDDKYVLSEFQRAAHLILRCGTDAAILVNAGGKSDKAQKTACLYYSPSARQAGLSLNQNQGTLVGFNSIFVACLVKQLARRGPDDTGKTQSIREGIKCGIQYCQEYFRQGLGSTKAPRLDWHRTLFAPGQRLGCVASIEGLLEIKHLERWSILEQQTRITTRDNSPAEQDLAEQIVCKGVKCAQEKANIPVARFRNLTVIDRLETESFRTVANLLADYIVDGCRHSPLSIGVFGPPGAGKSFGIREVAASVNEARAGVALEYLEYNLSQFQVPNDLATAFHQVRDASLSGTVPLVFIDEFDAAFEQRPFGWLKYFLMPMQDGLFKDGESIYHIGKVVFAFAGGLHKSFDELNGRLRSREFTEAKGPDFVSRLRAYVDVRGTDALDEADSTFRFRRAVILRVLLERKMGMKGQNGERISIDSGILRAFLEIGEYKHGVRSMDAIVEMSRIPPGSREFGKSCLPPKHQLEMHADARQFLELVNGS